jgi:subtilisin family serine protease
VDGNPAARILVARFTIDYHLIPPPPTIERAHKTAQTYRETVEYFKTHGVRVVNMSWGGTLRDTESDLEANGIGKDAEERAKLARELFDIEKEALYAAMQSAPNILFVNAAGNDNDDVSFVDYYPAAFDLTNLLVVGAVDQAGDETSFTSFGERVNVYANGYEVEGLLPGGDKLAASGTSTSSPNVANLAAKLFALEPSLTVDEVVSLIKEGAEQNKDGRLFLINPNRSVELLRSMKRK